MTTGVCEVEIKNSKDFSGDSSFEIVGGSVELIDGFRSGGRIVECSALGTNCIVLGSGEGEGVKEEANSITVNQLVGLKSGVVSEESVNIHLDMSHGMMGQVYARTCEVEKVNGSENMVAETSDLDSGKIINTTESSQATDFESNPPLEDSNSSPQQLKTEAINEKLKEQIKNAQLQLDEKIKCRYAIWVKIQENRAMLKAHNEALKTAYLEVIAATKLRRSKMPDLHSIQRFMEKVKDAEDIDNWHMHKVEDMIEIVNQKHKIQERLKNLDEEVNTLRDNVLKAEVAALVIGKLYEEENKKGKELKAQFLVADEVCQHAYAHLKSLKRRLYDKNKFFYMYKKDTTAARNFASSGDKAALCGLCANQVERFMEEWNTNEEFRKNYISKIRPSTRTPDETLCVSEMSEKVAINLAPIPSEMESVSVVSKVEQGKRADLCVSDMIMSERVATNSIPILSEMESVSVVSKVEEGKKMVLCVSDISERVATNSVFIPSETESVSVVSKLELEKKSTSTPDNQKWKVAGKTTRIMKKTVEPVRFLVRDSKFVCLSEIIEDEEKEKTVVEVDKKEDELSKKEIECNLKEQIHLEEKRKMNEAIERKKRNAENVQKRAELRAQKEAEQRRKTREKRLRRKERKRTGGDIRVNDEKIVKPNEANETEKPREVTLTIGDRRRFPQLWKMVTAACAALIFFLSHIKYVQQYNSFLGFLITFYR